MTLKWGLGGLGWAIRLPQNSIICFTAALSNFVHGYFPHVARIFVTGSTVATLISTVGQDPSSLMYYVASRVLCPASCCWETAIPNLITSIRQRRRWLSHHVAEESYHLHHIWLTALSPPPTVLGLFTMICFSSSDSYTRSIP
jgi:hypothetical protein